MENLGKAIFEHYEKYLGEMIGADSYPEQDLQVMGYLDGVHSCLTFATLGLSLHEQELGCLCETVFTTNSDLDACADVFVKALQFILKENLPMGPGLAINGLPEEFRQDHGKTALYFTEATQFAPAFRLVDQRCTLYMAMLLTAEEEEYLHKNGREKLEALLEANQADTIDPDRPSCC